MLFPTIAATLLAGSQLVAGHGVIIKAVGDAGGQGSAIGVDPSTPRDGTTPKPFEQDTTRFKGDAADSCGSTKLGGDNDAESGTAAVLQQNGGTLPQVTPGGSVQMTLHQVNSDGAGPYTCMIDSTGAGTNWQAIQVTQNVAGNDKGRDKSGQDADHPLNVQIPQDQTCTGTVAGQNNVCMVRCQNPANAGPFGGCVPVQMAGNSTTAPPGSAASNSTKAAGSSSTKGEKRTIERRAKKGKKAKGKKKGKKAAGASAGAAGAAGAGAAGAGAGAADAETTTPGAVGRRGIPFGGLLDETEVKRAVEIERRAKKGKKGKGKKAKGKKAAGAGAGATGAGAGAGAGAADAVGRRADLLDGLLGGAGAAGGAGGLSDLLGDAGAGGAGGLGGLLGGAGGAGDAGAGTGATDAAGADAAGADNATGAESADDATAQKRELSNSAKFRITG